MPDYWDYKENNTFVSIISHLLIKYTLIIKVMKIQLCTQNLSKHGNLLTTVSYLWNNLIFQNIIIKATTLQNKLNL